MKEKPAAVFGLARSGLATVRALRQAGISALAWDDDEKAREKARDCGAALEPLTGRNLKDCAFLVLSPGVPLHFPRPHPVVAAARKAGVEIICDIELFHRLNHGRKTIGVTGTNGKSTTTALIHHILKESGIEAVTGGNIGKPVFDLDMPGENGVFVFELSSYQLDLCPAFRPDIAVLLNVTPDHLDRHGTMENYAVAKEKIFESKGVAVIGIDDEYGRTIHDRVKAKGERKTIAVSVKDTSLMKAVEISVLKGVHNVQNALAAVAVCRELRIGENDIIRGLQSFPGLAHRQFPVRLIGNVRYINDSKATNAEAAGKALACFDDIFWIVGGRPKEGGLAGLEPFAPKIRHAFLIGESTESFAPWMEKNGVGYRSCLTLENAVAAAHGMAQENGRGTVLLSPACASFDQFSSYEERGERFKMLVKALYCHSD